MWQRSKIVGIVREEYTLSCKKSEFYTGRCPLMWREGFQSGDVSLIFNKQISYSFGILSFFLMGTLVVNVIIFLLKSPPRIKKHGNIVIWLNSPMLKGLNKKALWSQSKCFNISNEHIWIKQKSCRQLHHFVKNLSA